MFRCPRCQVHLEREETSRGVQWRCRICEGRAITVGVLRRIVRKDVVNAIWRAAKENERSASLPCALCRNAMTPVQQFDGLELDICTTCQSAWFDPRELEISEKTAPVPPVPKEPEVPQKVREILAMAEVERLRQRAEAEESMSPLPPEEAWKAILTLFGIPVETDAPAIRRWPWVTWLVLFLMTVATAWMEFSAPPAYKDWGLVPSDPWRHGGLTFLTSFFLHAGWIHLLGNAAFLFVFGDNVEDFLGHGRYALLLLLSSVGGDLLHIVLEPRGEMPTIGASGGISGVIVFYALAFPKARLVYLVRFAFFIRWLRFPAWAGLVSWLVLQMTGVFEQIHGASNVSSLAHLGGAGVGFLAWLATREWQPDGRNVAPERDG